MESQAAVEQFDSAEDLWPRVAKGDLEAANELARSTYRATYAALYRLCGGDEDLAADLTQETYRKAWQSLPRFRRRSQVATWLYRNEIGRAMNDICENCLAELTSQEVR